MFARRLGIGLSIEPAEAMARLCREKGVPVVRGVAEALPLDSGAFGLVAMITVECFLEDVGRALAEAARILEAQGVFVLAFLNTSIGTRPLAEPTNCAVRTIPSTALPGSGRRQS